MNNIISAWQANRDCEQIFDSLKLEEIFMKKLEKFGFDQEIMKEMMWLVYSLIKG